MSKAGSREHVPGKVIEEFVILHPGWEMDNAGWITDDGRVFTTNHGGPPYQMTAKEIDRHIRTTQASLDGLKRAREAIRALTTGPNPPIPGPKTG